MKEIEAVKQQINENVADAPIWYKEDLTRAEGKIEALEWALRLME